MKKKVLKRLAVFSTAMTLLMSSMTVFAAETTYTTKAGDNLSKIAKELYGDALKWREIYESNKDKIKDPNAIWSNQTLVIPDLGGETVVTPVPETPDVPETSVPEATATPVIPAASEDGFLQNVYNLMAAKDYVAMSNIDYDAADTFVASMDGNAAVYIPDGSLTGVGAGVYKYNDKYNDYYYFYYGSYVNGVRTGNGVSFTGFSNADVVFEGEWNNDAPNGYGVITEQYADRVKVSGGILVNGLWNGSVTQTLRANGVDNDFDLSYTADNGVAVEDATSAYMLAWNKPSGVGADEKIVAWDWCYDPVNNNYPDWKFTCTIGAKLGVIGFADE